MNNFIDKNGYLPNSKSEEEIISEGLNVGEAIVYQQEKIEEIFLYLIEMDEKIKALEKENRILKDELNMNR